MRRMTATALFIISAYPALAYSQERIADIHLDYARGTTSHQNSWGAGAALQLTWGGSHAPAKVSTSIGGDYMKQENSGPSQTSASLDIALQPGGSSAFTPYAGGSVSSNWSGGATKQWTGARLGLESLAGFQFKPSPDASIAWKAEERFGYVRGQEHTLATRLGILISI